MSLGIITYPRHLNKIIWGIIGGLEKRHKSLLHFSMKHGIMITDNKIELSPMGIDVLNGATTTDISGIPCVFYSSCSYKHDSRENTKRQEASDIR